MRTTCSSAMLREFTIQSGAREPPEDRRRVVRRRSPAASSAGTPSPQAADHSGVTRSSRVEGDRRERVVVDEREVDLVGGEQLERLGGLVLVDPQADRGVLGARLRDDGQQRPAHRGREARDAHRPGRLAAGVEIGAGGLDGREDRHGVVGEASPGGRQPHAAAFRLDQRAPASRASTASCCETVEVV